jgi:hypothetical protein
VGVHALVLLGFSMPVAQPPAALGALQTRWLSAVPAPTGTVPAPAPQTEQRAPRSTSPAEAPRNTREARPPAVERQNLEEKQRNVGIHAEDVAIKIEASVAATAPSTSAAAPAASEAAQPEAPAIAAALALPGSTRLMYDLRSGDNDAYVGTAELLWRHDGRQYEARLRAGNVLRDRVQTSQGRIDASGLAPERFVDKNRNEQATHFERQAAADAPLGRVVFSNNRPSAPITDGLQDRVSVFVQLAARAAAQGPLVAGMEWRVPTAGAGSAEDWVFRVQAAERLDLPGGSIATWKLERIARHEHDQRIELWVAPNLQWLPARIRITQSNGSVLDQVWSKTAAP